MRQGFYEDSLALLRFDIPQKLARSDVAVWQELTRTSAYTYLSRFEEAHSALAHAQTLVTGNQPLLLGEAYLRRGTLDSLQWKLGEARESYHSALDFARDHNDPFLEIASLGSLGLIATRMEHYDESVDWNKRALDLSRSHAAMGSAARIEGNIGWGYYEVGDLDGALLLYKKAAEDSQAAGLPEKRVTWLNNAAGVHYERHEFEAAEKESNDALALAKQLKDINSEIDCFQNLAVIALGKSQFFESAKYLAKSTELEKSAPDHPRELYGNLIAARLASKTGDISNAEALYLEAVRDPATPTSLRWEAQAGIAQVHAVMGNSVLAEREFRESINTISRAWNELQREEFRLSFLSSAIRSYDAYVDFLIEQKRPIDALKVADRSRAQTLEHGLSPGNNGKSEAREDIRPQEIARRWNATLLFYWVGEQRSHMWVITPAKVSLFPLPGRAEIDSRVTSYLEAFPDPRDPLEAGNADGKKLYETLIEPVERLIPKNSRVIILPDSKLNSLNFETLIVPGEKPHYWIDDVTVVTGNSLALLAKALPAPPPKEANLFLMGDALQASPDFPSLPQGGKEVGLVQSYFPANRRTVLTGAQAVPSRFLSGKPEAFSYLHFATHGTASTIRPLESAVVLSPEGDSYKLYARDVVQHPVHAYLVTISACNGAGMKTYAGEGLVGLAWAFLRAGAHSVIGGLWEVSNASTPQLMDELYKGLKEGKDPARALRDAKLTLLHSVGNYCRPFYWAPFQLYAGS